MQNAKLFVQFLHPGTEHWGDSADGSTKSWNSGEHRRKYLVHTGHHVRGLAQVEPIRGPIAFWGEWEPPSRVTTFSGESTESHAPTFFHVPFFEETDLKEGTVLQNTDPYVFGNAFRYGICRQFNSKKNNTQLRWLEPGSVVLFGSCVGREHFGLDTVFVVKDYLDIQKRRENESLDEYFERVFEKDEDILVDHHFNVSLRFIAELPTDIRLYRGVTFDERNDPGNDGMFSFVPCSPFDAAEEEELDEERVPRKARPAIEIPGVISPKQNQGYKFTWQHEVPEQFVRDGSFSALWEETVRQVLEAGCALGTGVDHPIGLQEAGRRSREKLAVGNVESRNDESQDEHVNTSPHPRFSCTPGSEMILPTSTSLWTRHEDDTLDKLLEDTREHYSWAIAEPLMRDCIVTRSIPVPYFGNAEGFMDSNQKVVTVGSNPSLAEFDGNISRFQVPAETNESHRATLNEYFSKDPYHWFERGYEKVLRHLDGSYGFPDGNPGVSIALHTDLLSPLATNPIWSKLPPSAARELAAIGIPFWHRLIDILKPDLILASVARNHLEHGIRFPKKLIGATEVRQKKDGKDRVRPYVLEKYELKLTSGAKSTLIWGPKQNMPFQDLGNEQKGEIGAFVGRCDPVKTNFSH